MTLATSSPISTPNLLWPFPFCQMDWAVTPPAVQDDIETLQGLPMLGRTVLRFQPDNTWITSIFVQRFEAVEEF